MTGQFNQVPSLPENWHGRLGSAACWCGDHRFGMLCGALSPGREASKGSLIIPLHLFLLRLLVNPLWLMLLIL